MNKVKAKAKVKDMRLTSRKSSVIVAVSQTNESDLSQFSKHLSIPTPPKLTSPSQYRQTTERLQFSKPNMVETLRRTNQRLLEFLHQRNTETMAARRTASIGEKKSYISSSR